MRLFFGTVVWCMFCMWMGMLFYGCTHQGLRETWQDCAGIYHEDCRDRVDDLRCEYEYYKVCINE